MLAALLIPSIFLTAALVVVLMQRDRARADASLLRGELAGERKVGAAVERALEQAQRDARGLTELLRHERQSNQERLGLIHEQLVAAVSAADERAKDERVALAELVKTLVVGESSPSPAPGTEFRDDPLAEYDEEAQRAALAAAEEMAARLEQAEAAMNAGLVVQ